MLDFPNNPTTGQSFQGLYWDGAKWVGSSQTNIAPTYNNVGRNLLHNALFNVAQRGAGPFTANAYGLDRWETYHAGASETHSVTQTALSDANRASIGDEAAFYAYQNVFAGTATAGSTVSVLQMIENVLRLSNKTVTLSFWAWAAAGAPNLGANISQNFGSGGSPSATVNVAGQRVTLSTTPARYSLTFNIPSAAGKTFGTSGGHYTGLAFWFSASTDNNVNSGTVGVQSGTINLWGVQLEIGSVATPLEKPDPADDLRKCQRFFQLGQIYAAGYGLAGNPVTVCLAYPVTMRASPTIVVTGGSTANLSSYSVASNTQIVFGSGTATATAGWSINSVFTASADL
jgi:hypothetical protein